MKRALEKAIRIVGSQAELARKLNVSRQAVHQWLLWGHTPVPRVLPIEELTEGRVTRHELRPDIYGKQKNGRTKKGGLKGR